MPETLLVSRSRTDIWIIQKPCIIDFMYLLFEDISEKNKADAIESLIKDSTAKPSFYFLVILSVLMAAYGLILNNTSVVIGSMLIAPLLSPIMSLALGITLSDKDIVSEATLTLGKSLLYSVLISMLATFLLWSITGDATFQESYNPEIMSRTIGTFPYFIIAVVAGLATSFARVKPELNAALPGTAIAVALVPPLATIGVGLATLNFSVALGALSLFLLNAIGIIAAAIVMFSLMRIYTKRKLAETSFEKALSEQQTIQEAFEKKKELREQEQTKEVDSEDVTEHAESTSREESEDHGYESEEIQEEEMNDDKEIKELEKYFPEDQETEE